MKNLKLSLIMNTKIPVKCGCLFYSKELTLRINTIVNANSFSVNSCIFSVNDLC